MLLLLRGGLLRVEVSLLQDWQVGALRESFSAIRDLSCASECLFSGVRFPFQDRRDFRESGSTVCRHGVQTRSTRREMT